MRTYPLKQSQVPEFLNGATTLRVPVRPQPIRDEDTKYWWWFVEYHDPDSLWTPWDADSLRDVIASENEVACPCPVGSELALTETWAPYMNEDMRQLCQALDHEAGDEPRPCIYAAEYPLCKPTDAGGYGNWRPAITMPAEFSRFKRRVVAVSVEHGDLWEWVLKLEAIEEVK